VSNLESINKGGRIKNNYQIQLEPTQINEAVLVFNGKDGWLMEICPDGKIVFSDKVKEQNPEQLCESTKMKLMPLKNYSNVLSMPI
jgi:hypothetical protein